MTTEISQLKRELKDVEIYINDIYDLVNTQRSYPAAIPVLIHALKEGIYNDGVKEGVIRALAVKEAKGKANEVLLEEFYKLPKEKKILRWIIGNTFEVIIGYEDIDRVIEIVTNKENGESRQMFILALSKTKSEKVEHTLIELLNDEEVLTHAIEALGKLKSSKAKGKINQLLQHSKPLVRKEAQKALQRIG